MQSEIGQICEPIEVQIQARFLFQVPGNQETTLMSALWVKPILV